MVNETVTTTDGMTSRLQFTQLHVSSWAQTTAQMKNSMSYKRVELTVTYINIIRSINVCMCVDGVSVSLSGYFLPNYATDFLPHSLIRELAKLRRELDLKIRDSDNVKLNLSSWRKSKVRCSVSQ